MSRGRLRQRITRRVPLAVEQRFRRSAHRSTGHSPQVDTFADVFKLTTKREVTIDVYVRYHGEAEDNGDVYGDGDEFAARVADALERELSRRVLV